MPRMGGPLLVLGVAAPLLLGGLAACAHSGARPATSDDLSALRGQRVRVGRGPGRPLDSAQQALAASVTHSEVTQQALKVFGDSLGPVLDSAGTGAAGGAAAPRRARPGTSTSGPMPPNDASRITWRDSVVSPAMCSRCGSSGVRDTNRSSGRSCTSPVSRKTWPTSQSSKSGYSPQAYSSAAAVGLWQLDLDGSGSGPSGGLVGRRAP